MNQIPKVSVLIPTYNREVLIAAAIESVLRQTVKGCEIIVMDDGSTDRTQEVVRHYEVEYPDEVRYLRQTDQGKSVALNNAMPHARGEYVAFLDSDDAWLPEKLEWQLRAIRNSGKALPCFTDARYVNNPSLSQTAFEFVGRHYDQEIGVVEEPALLFFETRSGIYLQTLVLQRSLARQVGDFDPVLTLGEDTDYLFRLGLVTPFCFVNRPLVEIDRTVNRGTGLIELMSRDELLRIRVREHLYLKWLDLAGERGPEMRDRLLGRLAETHNDWANWHLLHREYGKARDAMVKSVSTKFTTKAVLKLALTTIAPPIARKEYMRRDHEREKSRVTT